MTMNLDYSEDGKHIFNVQLVGYFYFHNTTLPVW